MALAMLAAAGGAIAESGDWPDDYWGERVDTPQEGLVEPGRVPVMVRYDDNDGRFHLDYPIDTGEPGLTTALRAMEVALVATKALEQLQMAAAELSQAIDAETEARVAQDAGLDVRVDAVRAALYNHMAATGDVNVTGLLARVAITGKYGDLGDIPALSEAESEDEGFFIIVNRVPDGDGIPDESEDRPEYGYVQLAEVARTGAYEDLVFESAPVTTIVTYEDNSLHVYNVSVGDGGKLEIVDSGNTVTLCDCEDGGDEDEGCGCGWEGYDPGDYLTGDEIENTYETQADALAEHSRLDGRIDGLDTRVTTLETWVEHLKTSTDILMDWYTSNQGYLKIMVDRLRADPSWDPSAF